MTEDEIAGWHHQLNGHESEQISGNTEAHLSFTILSFTISLSLLKLISIDSMIPSNQLILYAHFSSCPQSFPASGPFPMNWLFESDDQSMGASASASVFSMNIQDFFPLELSDLISLKSKGLSRVPTPQFKSINSLVLSFLYSPTHIHT